MPTFSWSTVDVSSSLPAGWRSEIGTLAAEADFRDYPRTPFLSREARDVEQVKRGRVRADKVRSALPWLYHLYRNEFLDLAAQVHKAPVAAAADDRYGVVLNVQRGKTMRFECHVDSNPLTGLLFFTSHPAGGGELVVGNDPAVVGVGALDRDCTLIPPHAGQLVFFDGRTWAHYARELTYEEDVRIVAVMNFYTEDYPEESTRPDGLNRHLFGQD
ncbi:MAG: 2OG-Fe(II) oxygenase [Streptosporangiaceae bacterium]